MSWWRRGQFDGFTPVSPEIMACVDEALAAWDHGISRLANEYLGPEIRAELGCYEGFGEGCRNAGVLATVMGQRDVAVALFRARVLHEEGEAGFHARGMNRGTFHWCAQVLSLPGWEAVFFEPCDADDLGLDLASEALSFPVTRRFIAGSDVNDPEYWSREPVPSMKQLLMDIAYMASYRFWPAYNDLGLSLRSLRMSWLRMRWCCGVCWG